MNRHSPPDSISDNENHNFKERTLSYPSLGLIDVKHKKKMLEKQYNSGMDFSRIPETHSRSGGGGIN